MGRYTRRRTSTRTHRSGREYSLTRVVIAFAQVIFGVIFLFYSVPVLLGALLLRGSEPIVLPSLPTILAVIGLVLVIWGSSTGKRMRRAKRSSGMTALGLATSLVASVASTQTQTPKRPPPTLQTAPARTAAPPPSGTKYVLVECEGCGAKSKLIEGTVGECEFCGSYLETKQPAKAK